LKKPRPDSKNVWSGKTQQVSSGELLLILWARVSHLASDSPINGVKVLKKMMYGVGRKHVEPGVV
jgi:hypothetical protein